jgi:uncharacterized protein YkwD
VEGAQVAGSAGLSATGGVGGSFAGNGGSGSGAGGSGAAAAAGTGGSAAGTSAGGASGFTGMGPPDDGDFGPPGDEEFGGKNGWDWGVAGMGADAVPSNDYCASVVAWDSDAEQMEQTLFESVNVARQLGYGCGPETEMGEPVPPLEMKPELRCAARLHSSDMAEGNYLLSLDSNGDSPEDRMRDAGYAFGRAAEIVAEENKMPQGMDRREALFEAIRAGGSDCQTLLYDRFDAIGIGVFENKWTLDFAGR